MKRVRFKVKVQVQGHNTQLLYRRQQRSQWVKGRMPFITGSKSGGRVDWVARDLEGRATDISLSLPLCLVGLPSDLSLGSPSLKVGPSNSCSSRVRHVTPHPAVQPPLSKGYLNVYPPLLPDPSCSVLVLRSSLFCVSWAYQTVASNSLVLVCSLKMRSDEPKVSGSILEQRTALTGIIICLSWWM